MSNNGLYLCDLTVNNMCNFINESRVILIDSTVSKAKVAMIIQNLVHRSEDFKDIHLAWNIPDEIELIRVKRFVRANTGREFNYSNFNKELGTVDKYYVLVY